MTGNRHQRRHAGKPQGMTYAQVLAKKAFVRKAVEQAVGEIDSTEYTKLTDIYQHL